jgi:hypothetical protein
MKKNCAMKIICTFVFDFVKKMLWIIKCCGL